MLTESKLQGPCIPRGVTLGDIWSVSGFALRHCCDLGVLTASESAIVVLSNVKGQLSSCDKELGLVQQLNRAHQRQMHDVCLALTCDSPD